MTATSDASPQDWPLEVRGRGLVVSDRIGDRWMTQFVANRMTPSVSEIFHFGTTGNQGRSGDGNQLVDPVSSLGF
jgi:hypothetical protein